MSRVEAEGEPSTRGGDSKDGGEGNKYNNAQQLLLYIKSQYMLIFCALPSCRRSCMGTHSSIKYQPDIHGCDVLKSREDGPGGQQDLHHHVKPVPLLKHKKCE
jgi:hypothetical protein